MGATFAYDALGRRAGKTINGQATSFRYDGLDVTLDDGATGSASYLRTLGIDEALTRTDNTTSVSYVADALGSTVGLVEDTGTLASTYTYAPFGHSTPSGSPSPNPFQFTGRESDGTGLYYYRARYYGPMRGRFVSEDPIGLAGGSFNIYQYAGVNPTRFSHPTGLKTWIYIQASAGGGLGPLAGEAGKYYLVDPFSGDFHEWNYAGGGGGLGFGGAVQLQGGVYEGPEDPMQISNWSLEVSGFAAAGKGASFSYTGTSFWGDGEAGFGVGYAGGAGAGISGLLTRSWYVGKGHVLPDNIRGIVGDLSKKVQGKKQ